MNSVNWIVCVAFGNLHLTKAAVESFLSQDIPVRVLLIDNKPQEMDGTGNWAHALHPAVVTLTNPKQEALGKVWNDALDLLFDREDAPHALVCNNDVVLRPDTYRLLLSDGGEFVTAVGRDRLHMIREADPSLRRPHPDFSCFMMRRLVWDLVGKFWPAWPAYAEDCDYHVRMHKAGIEARCIGVPYYHVGAASAKEEVDPEELERLHKFANENRRQFAAKWGFEIGSKEYEEFFRSVVIVPAQTDEQVPVSEPDRVADALTDSEIVGGQELGNADPENLL